VLKMKSISLKLFSLVQVNSLDERLSVVRISIRGSPSLASSFILLKVILKSPPMIMSGDLLAYSDVKSVTSYKRCFIA
jgi:hypothetical protein